MAKPSDLPRDPPAPDQPLQSTEVEDTPSPPLRPAEGKGPSKHTRFSLPGDDEEEPFALDTEPLTIELFSQYCKEDMKKVYDLVVKTALHRDHLLDRLEEVLPQALKLTQYQQAHSEVLEERDQAQLERDQLQSQVIRLSAQLVAQLDRSSTPFSAQPSSDHRSAKITDTDELTDGKNPTFESWKLGILDKFEGNADHFPSDRSRMIHVFSRTKGKARQLLETRYRTGRSNQFTTSDGMIAALAGLFEKPFKKEEAKDAYDLLYMKPDQTFMEFYTEFLHQAGTACVPDDTQFDDIKKRVTLNLRTALLPTIRSYTTMKELADQYMYLDQGQRAIKADRERLQKSKALNNGSSGSNPGLGSRPPAGGSNSSLSRTGSLPAAPSSTIAPHPGSSRPGGHPRAHLTAEQKDQLRREGKCFYCKLAGHRLDQCPTRPAPRINEVEAQASAEASSTPSTPSTSSPFPSEN
jgi:hypothetical protein